MKLQFLLIGALGASLVACPGGERGTPPDTKPPVILSVSTGTEPAVAGQRATLSVQVEGEVDSWQWTLPEHFYPMSSVLASPEIVWAKPGAAEGTVVASNAAGASVAVAFAIDVVAPTSPAFIAHRPGDVQTGIFANSVASVGQRPYFLQFDNQTGRLFCHTAIVANPTQAGEWVKHMLPPPERGEGSPSGLALIEGRRALMYSSADGFCWLTQALADVPERTADWQTTRVLSTGMAPLAISLNAAAGIPFAIVLQEDSPTEQSLHVLVASGRSPSGTGDWSTYQIAGPFVSEPDHHLFYAAPSWYVSIAGDALADPPAAPRLLESADPLLPNSWVDIPLPETIDEVLALWPALPGLGLLGFAQRGDEAMASVWLSDSYQIDASGDWHGGYEFESDGRAYRKFDFALLDERPVLTKPTDLELSGGLLMPTAFRVLRAFSPRPTSAAEWLEFKVEGGILPAGWAWANAEQAQLCLVGNYSGGGGTGDLGFWYLTPDRPW